MDPVFGGMISGGLGLIGSMFGASANNRNAQQMQQQAQQFNAAQTQQQQAFQEHMSSTAYQRASTDMQAAGLNPMMMFGSGSAASTPGGAAATTQPATKTSGLTSIGPAMDRIVSSAVSAKTFDKLTEEISNLRANEALTKAKEVSEREQPLYIKSRAYEARESGTQKTVQAQGTRSENVDKEKTAQYVLDHPWINEGSWIAKKVGPAVGQAVDVVNSALRARRGLSSHNFDMRWPR